MFCNLKDLNTQCQWESSFLGNVQMPQLQFLNFLNRELYLNVFFTLIHEYFYLIQKYGALRLEFY
jgi:hypothetical protein